MAQFLSFRGLRYNTEKVELSRVLCPPYDVIKGAARDELLAKDAHNIVAIELAARYGENATPEQYAASAALLEQWTQEGLFLRDDASYYVYEQQFLVPGTSDSLRRRGVIGALTVEEFGSGVLPHEHTLSGPKADRLNLLRALRTNTSPIFGLVADEDGWIVRLIEDVVLDHPVCAATDAEGITHTLWKVTDDEMVNAFEAAFENEAVLIADGHHRYETALNYFKETGSQADGASSVMMMCVSTSDAGLVVLPTHRVVKNVEEARLAGLVSRLSQLFEVTPTQHGPVELAASIPSEGTGQIAMHLKGQSYLLSLKNGLRHLESMESGRSEAYNTLDVSLLHRLILENELGVGQQELAAGQHVLYTIDAEEAVRKVEAGEAGAAFLLRPTPVDQVQAVAASGDKMPQKSTYFYPKLMTGLVLRPLD